MLSPYRVVIKVPHTGPVNAQNVGELLTGDKKFHRRFDQGETKDMVRGHQLALLLRDHGFRVNFTLMLSPTRLRWLSRQSRTSSTASSATANRRALR